MIYHDIPKEEIELRTNATARGGPQVPGIEHGMCEVVWWGGLGQGKAVLKVKAGYGDRVKQNYFLYHPD